MNSEEVDCSGRTDNVDVTATVNRKPTGGSIGCPL